MKDIDDAIDFESAIKKANLTDRQHTALLLWIIGHSHSEIARLTGTKRSAVTRLLGRAAKKLFEFM